MGELLAQATTGLVVVDGRDFAAAFGFAGGFGLAATPGFRIFLAALWTAFTMVWYPVQRQRFPLMARRISGGEGLGDFANKSCAAMSNPGVQ
jgi:hypothetical protein